MPARSAPARRDDGVEAPLGPVDRLCSSLPCPLGLGRIRLHDDDLPAGELERPRVDAGEAELEHAAGPVSQELQDPRHRARGQGRRQPSHTEKLTFVHRGASRRG